MSKSRKHLPAEIRVRKDGIIQHYRVKPKQKNSNSKNEYKDKVKDVVRKVITEKGYNVYQISGIFNYILHKDKNAIQTVEYDLDKKDIKGTLAKIAKHVKYSKLSIPLISFPLSIIFNKYLNDIKHGELFETKSIPLILLNYFGGNHIVNENDLHELLNKIGLSKNLMDETKGLPNYLLLNSIEDLSIDKPIKFKLAKTIEEQLLNYAKRTKKSKSLSKEDIDILNHSDINLKRLFKLMTEDTLEPVEKQFSMYEYDLERLIEKYKNADDLRDAFINDYTKEVRYFLYEIVNNEKFKNGGYKKFGLDKLIKDIVEFSESKIENKNKDWSSVKLYRGVYYGETQTKLYFTDTPVVASYSLTFDVAKDFAGLGGIPKIYHLTDYDYISVVRTKGIPLLMKKNAEISFNDGYGILLTPELSSFDDEYEIALIQPPIYMKLLEIYKNIK